MNEKTFICRIPAAEEPSKSVSTSIKEDGEGIMVISPSPWSSQASFMSLESRSDQHAHTHNIPRPTFHVKSLPQRSPKARDWLMCGGEVDGDWTGDRAEPYFYMHQCSPGKDQGRRERGRERTQMMMWEIEMTCGLEGEGGK